MFEPVTVTGFSSVDVFAVWAEADPMALMASDTATALAVWVNRNFKIDSYQMKNI